jgi:chromosome partitioning protein
VQSEYTINDVINKKVDISKVIIGFDNGLNVIPGSHRVTETAMKLKVNNRLKEVLKDIRNDYSYILLDTAPSLTILTVNSFVTSHEIWISFQPEWLATTGIKNILDTVKLLRDKLDISPTIRVIVTMYDQRKLLHNESTELIKKQFDNVFDTRTRTNVSIAEAPGNHKTIFDYAPNSHDAIDYMALCKEIERKIK